MGKSSSSTAGIFGQRTSGTELRNQNVTAAVAVANIVRTSLGPSGLDKMIVDNVGDVVISNDGATILKQIEVEHPAAKVLVELSDMQDKEVGDGTTSVVIIASELLKRANQMILHNIHPTSIMAGFRTACRLSVQYCAQNVAMQVTEEQTDILRNIVKTTLSSKIAGVSMELFQNILVESIKSVRQISEKGDFKYPIKSINILKSHGKSISDSELIPGIALNCVKASEAMPRTVKNAKIACFDMSLQRVRMKLGVQVVIDDPTKLDAVREREVQIVKERIEKILATGANVVLCTGGIDDLCLKYFVENNALAVRRVLKEDMRRICKATGATMVSSLADFEGEESFEASYLGEAESVEQVRISDEELIMIKNPINSSACSILLRGPNEQLLDELERSIHDALCALRRALESKKVVPGGGCVEAALCMHLERKAQEISSREQVAVMEFAEALLTIPKQLASNSALDTIELVARLRALHNESQTDETKKDQRFCGLDLRNGTIRNNFEAGVLEPALVKMKALQFATEAAISILRIDDCIKLTPEPQQ
ncbi:hypothetical protein RCL1_002556 [Eukaryota sp. TZLM3-RCL]